MDSSINLIAVFGGIAALMSLSLTGVFVWASTSDGSHARPITLASSVADGLLIVVAAFVLLNVAGNIPIKDLFWWLIVAPLVTGVSVIVVFLPIQGGVSAVKTSLKKINATNQVTSEIDDRTPDRAVPHVQQTGKPRTGTEMDPVEVIDDRIRAHESLMDVDQFYLVRYGQRTLALRKKHDGKVQVYGLPR